jgi:4-hydroxy-tetrahydrodipicolinate reductase
MVKLVVGGCCGRMGLRIAYLAYHDKDITLTGAFERDGNPHLGKPLGEILKVENVPITVTADAEAAVKRGDVLVEFTTPEATLAHLDMAKKHGTAMVIGTTAIDDGGKQKIRKASQKIPIVFSPNMSVGVNVLFALVQEAAAALKGYQANMSETHHRHKKDAPSGTAKRLAQIIQEVCGTTNIPIESIREGEVIGDHTVVFDGPFERLELKHHAKTRDVFAGGALVAAKFVATKKRGLFSMQDVLK